MTHKKDIEYDGGYKALAEDLANLEYDSLCEFLQHLALKVRRDAQADHDRQRYRLFQELYDAANSMRNAWIICQPYMHEEQEKIKQNFIKGGSHCGTR